MLCTAVLVHWYYLSCLGVWHHVYYQVHYDTQWSSSGSLFFTHLGGIKVKHD